MPEEHLIAPHADLDTIEAGPRVDMTSEQVLERIQNGQSVANAKITRLRLRGEFTKPIRFHNCVLIKPEFDAATFQETVTFHRCTVDRPHFNRKNVFKKDFDLTGSTIVRAVVREVTIGGTFKLMNADFRGKFHVLNCRFEGQVFFWDATIDAWLEFKNCDFVGVADFRSMHCDEGVVFRKCRFHGDFLLRGTAIAKKLDFENSRFEGLLDLSKAKLHDFVYMESIEQGPNQQFVFWNALAERILIRPDQIEGRLASESKTDCGMAMQEYGLLKSSFQHLHRFDYEDWAFYRFKVNQRRGCGRSWKRPWTKVVQFFNWLFLDLGCGYGTNPMRAVTTSLIIIAVFSLIYMTNPNAFFVEQLPFPEEPQDSPGNTVMIGILTSVAVFTSGMAGIRDLAQGWMNLPLILESLLGTLLFGLFIVAFSRKVIR